MPEDAPRRSARVAAQPKPAAPVPAPAVKKAKPAPKPAPQEDAPKENGKRAAPASKDAPKEKKAKPASKEKPAEKEKPKSAEKDKPKSVEKEKSKSADKPKSDKAKPKSADKPKSAEKAKTADAPKSADGALAVGDALPAITLQDNTGADVDVSKIAGEKGVVFFLYPKADTPGCTTQACGYRDIHDEIAALGYDVYGLSKDKPAAQQKWVDKKSLNYKLLCDPESQLIKRLGAFVAPNSTKRSHFIFEKGSGKLVDIALGVKPANDPTNVLEFIKKHHA